VPKKQNKKGGGKIMTWGWAWGNIECSKPCNKLSFFVHPATCAWNSLSTFRALPRAQSRAVGRTFIWRQVCMCVLVVGDTNKPKKKHVPQWTELDWQIPGQAPLVVLSIDTNFYNKPHLTHYALPCVAHLSPSRLNRGKGGRITARHFQGATASFMTPESMIETRNIRHSLIATHSNR